jgi:hypothetical protein
MSKYLAIVVLILCSFSAWSQDSTTPVPVDTSTPPPVVRKTQPRPRIVHKDTTAVSDSLMVSDSLRARESVYTPVHRPTISLFSYHADTPFFAHHPAFRFTDPVHYTITIKKWQGKEAIFYSIIALLLFFALIRNGFYRYLQDLFRTYFQTTVNQKQAKEHLLQNPLPSLLLNLFFVLSIGMFLALMLQYYKLGTELNFWVLYFYCILGLVAIYGVKYISLKLFGWIFQVSEAIESYIFIVFTTNKIIGICLLPFLVMLAFTYGLVNQTAMTLSIIVVLGLLAYRFFLSYVAVRRQISISFLHFFLYLCAFELIPLLLINKLLFRFLGERT